MKTPNRYIDIIKKPVWYTTGCFTSFNHEQAIYLLDCCFRTVFTNRNPVKVEYLASMSEGVILEHDVTNQEMVDAALQAAEEKLSHIDVLVNNAGNGYQEAVEESEEVKVRRMFKINVFGLNRIIHGVRS